MCGYDDLLHCNEDNVVSILQDGNCRFLDREYLFSSVANTSNGSMYIIDNFDAILDCVSHLDDFIFLCYRTFLDNREFIKSIAYHRRLDVRASFMLNVTECEKSKLREYYPNICEYLVNKDESGKVVEIIDEELLSSITANILDCVYDKELFNELKEFILSNYKNNHLLNRMHAIDIDNDTNDLFHVYEEISSDIERLYKTSSNYQLEFLYKCREMIPEYLRNVIECGIREFKYCMVDIEEIFSNELGNDFLHLLKRYSSISQKPIIRSWVSGTVCKTFLAGDFLVKYIDGVYNIYGADYPCPRLFLINKPYKEIVAHSQEGYFLGKLEVQSRLFEPLREDQKGILDLFEQELENLGFFCDDLYPYENRYNIYRLRDYHDADTTDPESLPEWFKKNPYVLVDRDCVYPIEKREEVEKHHSRIFK